jgi:hypothetical protein
VSLLGNFDQSEVSVRLVFFIAGGRKLTVATFLLVFATWDWNDHVRQDELSIFGRSCDDVTQRVLRRHATRVTASRNVAETCDGVTQPYVTASHRARNRAWAVVSGARGRVVGAKVRRRQLTTSEAGAPQGVAEPESASSKHLDAYGLPLRPF